MKDTHYHSKLRQAIFTNSDWNLILKCPVPVWLSKPHNWPADARIIASIDPAHEHDLESTLDALILDEADMLASKLSGELHVFHAHVPLSSHRFSSPDSRVVPMAELEENFDEDRRESYEALVTQRKVPDQRSHWIEGEPHTLLPELATSLDAGLVVMGAIARNKLQSIFVGSTTEKVLDRLPCDLMIVKPNWFSTPVVPGVPDYYTGTREKLPTPHLLDDDEYGSFDEVAM
ncbi:MAG: universal stress protein [Woeseia sp.]|nr:universal stress protein [Woeseia sp.]